MTTQTDRSTNQKFARDMIAELERQRAMTLTRSALQEIDAALSYWRGAAARGGK